MTPSCGWRARTSGPASPAPWPALPWRLRQVIVLRDIYDMPHGAIAAELGISEAAAKVGCTGPGAGSVSR